jgi:hypothetical protein
MNNNEQRKQLFSIDEFKRRLHEAKDIKNCLSERNDGECKGRRKGIKVTTFTINDNEKLLGKYIGNGNRMFDDIYDDKHKKIESQLSLYVKKQMEGRISGRKGNDKDNNNNNEYKKKMFKGNECGKGDSNRSYVERYKRKMKI